MKRRSLLLGSAALLAGCGGGSKTSSGLGRAVFIIEWPKSTRLLPAASQSIRIDIKLGSTTTQSRIVPRPTSGANAMEIVFDQIAPDTYTVTIDAFPNSDATGVIQASGNSTLIIQDGAASTISVTLESTISSIQIISTRTVFQANTSANFEISALNSNNSIVLISSSNVFWNSNSSNTTIESSGNPVQAQFTTRGFSKILATDSESHKNAESNIFVIDNNTFPDNHANSWSSSNGNSGKSSSIDCPSPQGSYLWSKNIGASPTSSPIISSSGILYIPVESLASGGIVAINSNNQEYIWEQRNINPISTPTLTKNNILIFQTGTFGMNGKLHALDSTTGSSLWEIPAADNLNFSAVPPISLSQNRIISINGLTVRGINETNGQIIWSSSMESPILASSYNKIGFIYIFNYPYISAIDIETGKRAWTYNTHWPARLSDHFLSVNSNGNVVASNVQGFIELNGITGQLIKEDFGIVSTTPAVNHCHNDQYFVYFQSHFAYVYDVNLQYKRFIQIPELVVSLIIVRNDLIVNFKQSGDPGEAGISKYDLATGNLTFRTVYSDVTSTQPCLSADGRIYVTGGSFNRGVACIQ